MEVELHCGDGVRAVWLGRIAYAPALALQESLAFEKARDPEHTPDTLLLLEHEPVYTIGRNPDRSSLANASNLPYPVETIHRGGQATYHGPGQLVGYAVLDLARRGRDLHRYLRALEAIMIRALAAHGVSGARREALTGVWVGDRKIASIGVGVRHWISMHGFALNVVGAEALPPFAAIVPCGIQGVEMTALDLECGRPVRVDELARDVAALAGQALEELLPRQTG